MDTFMILTFKGRSGSDDSSPSSGGQGSSLQGSTIIGSPLQGSPSARGGIHFLCKVLVPPPHFNVQVDQSCKGTQ